MSANVARFKGQENFPASIYITDNTPNAELRYRARFYFDPNSIAMTNGNAHYILYGYSGATQVLRVVFQRAAGLYQVRTALRNDGAGWTSSAWFTITDDMHFIELDWRAATAIGANDGGLSFWIDGVQQANLTGVDNDTRRIDSIQLGAVAGIDTATRGTYYFDAFESRRLMYIGPDPNVVIHPPLPDLIFANGFETGNLCARSDHQCCPLRVAVQHPALDLTQIGGPGKSMDRPVL